MASRKATPRAGPGHGSTTASEDGVNIQVILRCRPPTKEELASRAPQVVKCNEALREITLNQTVGGKQLGRTYHFDRVFPGDTAQEKLYDSTVAPLVEEMLEGFNCTIFAYGQTGTGKTYTMTGGDLTSGSAEMTESAGVIPRAIHQVFSYLEGLGAQEFTVKASYLELYNEEVTDLLALGSEPPKVRILEDRTGVVLAGLEEAQVRTAGDIFALLDQGTAKRRTAETLLNKQSSRSHTVFVITVSVREILAEGEEVIRVGKLYLVDLAGSENISRSGAVEARAKEAGNINKSLLTLGRVITALVEGQGHVPYRDSKLTRLLRDSLGGRTKTCIIATVAPTVQCQEETLSTLEYAHRAKNIKNKPEINQKISKTTHLKEMNVEIEKLKTMLNAAREKNGIYLPAAQYEEECEERKFLNARHDGMRGGVVELEEAAEISTTAHEAEKAELAATATAERAALQSELQEVQAAASALEKELEAARVAIEEGEYLLLHHQQHEARLADHAAVLTLELGGAAADLALLFTRVDAKQSLEDHNWSVVTGMRAAVAAALDRAAAGVQRGVDGVTAAALQSAELCARERERRAAQRRAEAGTEEAQGAATLALAAAGARGLAEVREAAAASAATAAEARASALAASAAAGEEARRRLAASAGAVLADLETGAQALESLDAEVAAAAAESRAALEGCVRAGTAGLASAGEGARAAGRSAADATAAAAEAVDEVRGELASMLTAGRQELVATLADAVQQFVAEAEARLADASLGLRARLEADGSRLTAELAAAAAAAEAGAAELEVLGAAAGEALVDRTTALARGMQACGAAGEAAGTGLRAAADAAERDAADARARLEVGAEAEAAAAAALGAAVDGAARQGVASGEAAAAAATAAAEARGALDAQRQTADDAAAARHEALSTAAGEAARTLAAGVSAELADAGQQLTQAVDAQYILDANKDAVPTQRVRVVPAASELAALRTPARPTLLAAFRAARGSTGSEGAEPLPATQVLEATEGAEAEQAEGAEAEQAEGAEAGSDTGSDAPQDENRDAGNTEAPPSLDVPMTGLKLPTILSPGMAGVKRGRPAATASGASTPVSARSPVKTRVPSRRGTRRAPFEV